MLHELFVKNWVDLLFAGITALFGFGYRSLANRLKAEQEKNENIANGIQCLLRLRILDSYYLYTRQGYCPVDDKQSLSKAYDSYRGLGGNDVATKLYKEMLELPSDPPLEEKTNHGH